MTEDPVRLLSQEDDAFTASLLRSARDGDRDAARAHKAIVLGAAGGAAAGTAALATAARLSSRGFFTSVAGKWILTGLLVLGGVGGAALLWPGDAPDPSPSSAAAAPVAPSDAASQVPAPSARGADVAPAPPAAVESSRPASAPTSDPSAARAPSSDPRAAAAPSDPARASSRPAAGENPDRPDPASGSPSNQAVSAPPAASASGLAEEVAALTAARAALAKGQPARSLDALNAYFAAFPAGRLSAEARMVRVEALSAAGRRDEAKSLARAMLVQNPKSPYAARLRAIAGEDAAP